MAEGKKKKPEVLLTRDLVIRRLNSRRKKKEPSPLVMLREVLEETKDKDRFVGDTMFWKYFEDIDLERIKHTDSVEYRNLWIMFWETIFFVLLLTFFSAYAFSLQSQEVYEARQEQFNYWSGCESDITCRIQHVDDRASFWHWMREELVPRAYTHYSSPPASVASILTEPSTSFPLTASPRFIGPQASNLVLGSVRLRQLRVTKNMGCQVSKLIHHVYPDCYGPYSDGTRSEMSYHPRFVPTYLTSAFSFMAEEKTGQTSLSGGMATYPGSGFTFDLTENRTESLGIINDLWQWHWVDHATRAVIVELSVVNVNVNVIVNNRILFEFGPTGSVLSSVKSSAAQVFFFAPSTSAGAGLTMYVFQILVYILFLLFTFWSFWLMYKTCQNYIGQSPLKYLKKADWPTRLLFPFKTLFHYYRYGWNVVDLGIMVLFYTHFGFRFEAYRASGAEPNLAPETIGHPELFMPLSSVMYSVTMSKFCLAGLALGMWVRLFKYLCMIGYFRMLIRIIERCTKKLFLFAVLLIVVFAGFGVAFNVGFGERDENYKEPIGSFLVLIFLLIDGYAVDPSWFEPGRSPVMAFVFYCYIALIYFVLLNIFVAVLLDAYATGFDVGGGRKKQDGGGVWSNPMALFVWVYMRWSVQGISEVHNDSEQNLKKEDLDIRLQLLPGIVRRKWVEKKRRMQRVANQSFAGLELFTEDKPSRSGPMSSTSDWMLPNARMELMNMTNPQSEKPVSLYDIPGSVLKQEVSWAQLQRLMDEDETLPLLLGSSNAVEVIRKFKRGAAAVNGQLSPEEAVKALQGEVFGRVDKMEKVDMDDDDIPEVPEVQELTDGMSGAVSELRSQFRMELTTVIEATASLFEHLIDVTQNLDAVGQNNEDVVAMVKEAMGADGHNLDSGFSKGTTIGKSRGM